MGTITSMQYGTAGSHYDIAWVWNEFHENTNYDVTTGFLYFMLAVTFDSSSINRLSFTITNRNTYNYSKLTVKVFRGHPVPYNIEDSPPTVLSDTVNKNTSKTIKISNTGAIESNTVYIGFSDPYGVEINISNILGGEEYSLATPTFPKNLTYVNPRNEIEFKWSIHNQYGTVNGSELEYNLDDGQGWVSLGEVGGETNTLTVPANTFGIVDHIHWRVRSKNGDGDWGSLASAIFTTKDAPSIATAILPSGTIEDTDSDLLFRWSSSSPSGAPPTQADIQYSYDGNTWISLEPTDGTPYTTVPGGTIHAGTIQWRVRSYNRDHTPGNWSTPATFVARAAPKIQEVTTDGKPFTTITWQATDQQTYEIEVDGYSYGSIFGKEKSFLLPDYLEDGIHSVRVRVQNELSMWSQPGELTFSVLNTPGAELLLSGDFDLDADLFWEDNSGHADYLVYRDGTCIGETSHKHFSDRVVLGEHTYYVVNRFDDGCFSKSNIVEHTLNTDVPQLALLSGGDWLPLEKSENTQQTQRFTHSRKVAYHHFSGDKNQTPEVGDEEVLTAEFDAAWFYTEEGSKTLKSLLGQALIIKSRGEEVVIGVLEAYTKVNRKHFRGYAFSIRQMEWKDYICAE